MNDIIKHIYLNRYNNEKVILADHKTKLSYAELYRAICRNIRILNTKSQYVGIIPDNNVEFAICFFATILSGKTLVIMGRDNNLKNQKIEKVFKLDVVWNKNLKCILNKNEMVNNQPTIWKQIPSKKNVLVMNTSGTMGERKFVYINYENLKYRIYYTQKYYKRNSNERELLIVPIETTLGNQQQLLTCMSENVELFLYSGLPLPRRIIDIIQKNSINNLSVVPSILKLFVEYLEKNNTKIHLSKIYVAGDKCSKDILIRASKVLQDTEIYIAYGLTEIAPVAIKKWSKYDQSGNVGKVIEECKIKIITNECKEAKNGERGEILIKDCRMLGKYDNEFKIPWFATGDIGYINHKCLYICGRKKNIIIVNGLNVHPEKIEAILVSNSEIESAMVTGESDDIRGEKIIAYIKTKDNMNIEDKMLRKYCEKYLDKHEIPNQFIRVKNIKKNNMNKVVRY